MAVFRMNRDGFQKIALSPEVRRALVAVAEKAKAHAEELSGEFRRTGDYQESFEVVETIDLIGEHPRAAARLVNTSDHAAAVEWGYEGRAAEPGGTPHRVLGRTLAFLDAGAKQ